MSTKTLSVFCVCLAPLLLNACASYAHKESMVQDAFPENYELSDYISTQYPDYVTLVRLPDVNTTSKVIRID